MERISVNFADVVLVQISAKRRTDWKIGCIYLILHCTDLLGLPNWKLQRGT